MIAVPPTFEAPQIPLEEKASHPLLATLSVEVPANFGESARVSKERFGKTAKQTVRQKRIRWSTQRNRSAIGELFADRNLRVAVLEQGESLALDEGGFQEWAKRQGQELVYSKETLFADLHLLKKLTGGNAYGPSLPKEHQPPLFLSWVSSRVGWGAFAKRSIQSGEAIGRYTGVVCEAEQGNSYSLAHPALGESYMIDATHFGNETRFINHSAAPNCEFVPARNDEGILEMVLVALRVISPDEQLLVDYGDHYWQGITPEIL